MNFFVQLALIIAFAVQSFGELLHCREIMQEVCSKTDNYVSSISPDPLPTKVGIIWLRIWRGSMPACLQFYVWIMSFRQGVK